jgi:hypothetical protein
MTQTDPIIQINILKVGTAFRQGLGGRTNIDTVEFSDKIKREDAGDTAHGMDSDK